MATASMCLVVCNNRHDIPYLWDGESPPIIGALIIRIGFGVKFYYNYNKESPNYYR